MFFGCNTAPRGINVEELRVVVLDEVTTEEAQFVLELAYGMGRCAIFMTLKYPDEIYMLGKPSNVQKIILKNKFH